MKKTANHYQTQIIKIMGFWNKIKKGVTDTTNKVVDTTINTANTVVNTTTNVANDVANKSVEFYEDNQKVIVCTEAIANCAMDVQGHDPRKWMTACAAETLFKGGGTDQFKQCLIGKMEKEVKDISDPVGYANKLYDSVKNACS